MPDGKFADFQIIEAATPLSHDLPTMWRHGHLDLAVPRSLERFDKLGCKLLLKRFKHYFLGSTEARLRRNSGVKASSPAQTIFWKWKDEAAAIFMPRDPNDLKNTANAGLFWCARLRHLCALLSERTCKDDLLILTKTNLGKNRCSHHDAWGWRLSRRNDGCPPYHSLIAVGGTLALFFSGPNFFIKTTFTSLARAHH